jgi:hypothetical protein
MLKNMYYSNHPEEIKTEIKKLGHMGTQVHIQYTIYTTVQNRTYERKLTQLSTWKYTYTPSAEIKQTLYTPAGVTLLK